MTWHWKPWVVDAVLLCPASVLVEIDNATFSSLSTPANRRGLAGALVLHPLTVGFTGLAALSSFVGYEGGLQLDCQHVVFLCLSFLAWASTLVVFILDIVIFNVRGRFDWTTIII